MSHIFNTSDYLDFRGKIYSSIKKTLQQKIDQASQLQKDNELHPCDGTDEMLIDGSIFNFVYEDELLQLPSKILDVKDFKNLLNVTNLTENLTQEQMSELFEYLPENNKNLEGLKYALGQPANTSNKKQVENKQFQRTPLEDFQIKLKKGYFSSLKQKQDEIQSKLIRDQMHKYYSELLQSIEKRRKQQKKGVLDQEHNQEASYDSFQQLDALIHNQQGNRSQNSATTQTQQEMIHQFDQEPNKQIFFKYDYSKIRTQEEILAMGQQRGDKKVSIVKNTLTIRPKNQQWVDNYRRQQLQRYSNPTKPWVYNCQDGRKVTVAPVAKKMSVLTGKPRDHPMLKLERPACVTILTLVRDAAARLPNGVGTRADICELLKQSQYVNEDLPQQKVSSIVSGALDRLHYMADACVKYDSEKKLWIYLHTDRNHQHPGWGDDGQEYTEKKNYKKRKSQFE